MSKILIYTSRQIQEYKKFLENEKKICNYFPLKFFADANLLNDGQRKCFDFIEQALKNSYCVTRCIVMGSAGSGKHFSFTFTFSHVSFLFR